MKNHEGKCHRLMLAALKSGSGKTTITCGLIRAMQERGNELAVFKCGPDYIDPMFHAATLGVKTGNLDSYFLDRGSLQRLMKLRAGGADLTIIEGVMGYFDGLGGVTSRASSAEVASWTDTPVLLIVDARGASLTLVPMLRGIMEADLVRGAEDQEGPAGFSKAPHSMIRGILLNRVSKSFYPTLKKLLEEELGIPVVGYLPQNADLTVPSRHLGLYSPSEIADERSWADKIAACMKETVDLTAVDKIAREAKDLEETELDLPWDPICPAHEGNAVEPVRIAVAYDEAFSFVYRENEELLERLGAEIVHISPLHDEHFPQNVSGLILSGGYPELFARSLWKNEKFREELTSYVKAGLPTIAECGGFLYLQKDLKDREECVTPMCGVFEGHGFATDHLVRFGYCEAQTSVDGLFGPAGTVLKGHEFHYYDTTENGCGMHMRKPVGTHEWEAGIYNDHMAAGFPHFYYESNPSAAGAFLRACRKWKH
ncbi:MAG: cobyrinate a,c-diamide synthase [Lachnospiraceae bacterium]|nr:cobyrinate a,c-diamide synthase [Lachnospiraceae bacterium]